MFASTFVCRQDEYCAITTSMEPELLTVKQFINVARNKNPGRHLKLFEAIVIRILRVRKKKTPIYLLFIIFLFTAFCQIGRCHTSGYFGHDLYDA